jgi:glycosyltransferase involved in cell wall biosynthesis
MSSNQAISENAHSPEAVGGQAFVSVIIPCYNQARFLSEAIESVLDQTYRRFEVIVVDDGSSDNTSEVAARYPSVRCYRQQNQGLAAARNRGLSQSTGDYLVFLDADDRLLPEALETGVVCLSSHPECAFAYGHIRLISSDGSPLASPRQAAVVNEHYRTLLSRNYIWTPGVAMYRRAVFHSVAGFNPLVNAAADYDLNIRIARDFPIYCHDKAVLEYRTHGSNMSGNPELMLRHAVTARRLQWKYVKGNRQYKEAYKAGLNVVQEDHGERLVNVVRARVRARKWAQAIRGILVLLRYYPQGFVRHAGRKLCAMLRVRKLDDDR